MRGAICYYSGTGNTRLACKYVAAKVGWPFDMIDITRSPRPDLGQHDVVGFATFTDFAGPPQLFLSFVEQIPAQMGKPAFVLNTFGAIGGKTLRAMAKAVSDRGFRVVGGHSLHTPENYPPMMARGMGADGAPNEKELAAFDGFIAGLASLLSAVEAGEQVRQSRVRVGLLNSIIPSRRRTWARDDMGEKQVNAGLCIRCGLCERGCPYGAIRLDPMPSFAQQACYGCWRCYNRCPEHAIYTGKFSEGPFYPKPSDRLRRALQAQ